MAAPVHDTSNCPYGPMLGEHAAEIRNLKEDVHAIREGQEKMVDCLTRIDRKMAEQRGSARALGWLLGAAATAGGVVSTVAAKFFGGHGQ